MKRLVLFLVLCATALIGCEGTIRLLFDGEEIDDTRTNPGAPVPTDPQSVADGAELYALYCESCHGPNAEGGATWSGSIQGFEPIQTIVENGVGTMAAIALSGGEIKLVQAYLLSFGAPDWSGLTGLELYATGCQSCHGAEAEGNDRGPGLRFKDAAYFEYVTRHGGWADRFGSPMTEYGADRVSDGQLDEMIAWIESLPNAQGGQGLYHQFCANCHGDATIRERSGDVDGSIATVCRSGKEKSDGPSKDNYMPGWSADVLSDAEIATLQVYFDAR